MNDEPRITRIRYLLEAEAFIKPGRPLVGVRDE